MALLTYLDLSTAHVTEKDMELLKQCDPDDYTTPPSPVYSYNYAHGAFVVAETEIIEQDCLDFGFSPSFCKVLKYANKTKVCIIRLDSDAEVLDTPELDVNEG